MRKCEENFDSVSDKEDNQVSMQTHNIMIIIPSLHPNKVLVRYVDDLISHGYQHILIVDDGSGTEYSAIFAEVNKKSGCEVIGYPINKGKGFAIKYAIKHVMENYDYVTGIITADSDGQHTTKDVERVAAALADNPHKIILGSRNFAAAGIPTKSRLGNRITSAVFALLFGKWLPDTQTGLRGFSRDYFEHMSTVRGNRFEYEMEVLISCANRGVLFHIVNIETMYIDGNKSSHFRPILDSLHIYARLLAGFLRYISASGLSTIVDIMLFVSLDKWLLPLVGSDPMTMMVRNVSWHVFIATAIARSVSAVINFNMNRKFVFQVKKTKGAFSRYVVLALLVMCVSAGLVSSLNVWLGIERTILKMIVDVVLFFINYRIQRAWVFVEAP